MIPFRPLRAACRLLSAMLALSPLALAQPNAGEFRRVATYPVFQNRCAPADEACIGEETVAEIVAATVDGKMLVYTDSPNGEIGFVDISNLAAPVGRGVLAMGGEPTSVAVWNQYALVAVNTSPSFTAPSGHIAVVEIATRRIRHTIDVGGQPDAIAVSRDGRYAAVAIENERNESLCVGGTRNGEEVSGSVCRAGGGALGAPGQAPGGFLVIVDTVGAPASWRTRRVSMSGLAEKFAQDPEPEFVDINALNQAAVTLQENNHLVIVDLATGQVLNHFSARTVDLTQIDTREVDLIEAKDTLSRVPREPDAVAWISPFEFATANEGDLEGGSRGFSIFRADGAVRFDSASSFEHLAMRIGHYPEDRSANKGSEPEGIEYGLYGNRRFLFVASERSSFVAVYEIGAAREPRLVQVLPATASPEGLLAIPSRNAFVASTEADERGAALRAAINLYELQPRRGDYPTIVSNNRPDGTPIPWAALSALAADRHDPSVAYTVYDSYFKQSRIFKLDIDTTPARIVQEIVLRDRNGATMDLDPEGLATREDGGFWVASEGAGSVDDAARPVSSKNLLLQVTPDGTLVRTVELPAATNALQRRFGFEGVASVGRGANELVYVCIQREWLDDPAGFVRIGRFHPASGEWRFYYYPLDRRESPNGGWVGLSEIVSFGQGRFGILERDNQGGTDARIKRIYEIDVTRRDPQPEGGAFPVLDKRLVRDILPDLTKPGGLALEKVEGLAMTLDGVALIVTDNDGVEDHSGETQLIDLGRIF